MGDIYCKQCGEPWDSYGITRDKGDGDLTILEVPRFLKGEGCPSCEFATICTHCRATGLERAESILRAECGTCHGEHFSFVHKFVRLEYGYDPSLLNQLVLGYKPNTRILTPEQVTILGTSKWNKSLEGWYVSLKILCPDCCKPGHKHEVCSVCKGDRKFHKQSLSGAEFGARLNSLLEASDEEPISLIDGWMGGE